MNLELSDFLIRIFAALALGLAIGIERQLGQHPAGLRTNSLVCLGSAFFVSMSMAEGDGMRVAAQVVSGIGFICGGAILREGLTVRGMNTAATLWCTAAIGALIGIGFIFYAVLATIAVLGAHLVFRPLAHAIDNYTQGKGETELLYKVKLVCQRDKVESVRAQLVERIGVAKLRLQGLELEDSSQEQVEMKVHLYALQHDEQAMNDLVSRLACLPEVSRVSWGKAS